MITNAFQTLFTRLLWQIQLFWFLDITFLIFKYSVTQLFLILLLLYILSFLVVIIGLYKELIGACIRAAVPNIFGTRDWFRGRQFFHEWGQGTVQAVMRVMVQAVMWALGSGRRASLARSPPTFCCADQFLTGCRLVPVHGTSYRFSSHFVKI